jgi:tetratricopeptide (TPR) repeat protein
MTDLSELLDSRLDERIMHSINDLDFDGFKALISELLGGIGVKVTRMDVSEDAAFFEGISEEGKYFVVASRLFDNASVESMKVLKDMAVKRNAVPVLIVTCDLDDEEKKFAEAQGISYADKPKLLMLLRKYDLAGKMMAELDHRILEQDRNRYLPSGAQFDAFYNAAEEHVKHQRYRDALYNYDRALDIKPNNDVVWMRKANVFLAMGRFEDALVACKRASELRPGDATTWYLMGLAYNQLGDFEKELKAYDTALKIQPRMEAALLNKGATLFQLHRYDWALKVYEDMCNFFPKDAMAFNNRGIVLKAMGRHKEALESFDRASFLNRNYIDPVVNRALTLVVMGRSEEAIEAWTNSLQIDRDRADIWYSLGMSQKEVGMIEEAVRSFDKAVTLDKGLTEAVNERDELLAAAEMVKSPPGSVPIEVAEPVQQQVPVVVPEKTLRSTEPPSAIPEPELVESAPAEPEVAKPERVQTPETIVNEVVASPKIAAEEEHVPSIELEIKTETVVPAPELISPEVPIEAKSPSVEVPSPAIEEAHKPIPFVEEATSLVPTESEVALLVKESPRIEIQQVEGNTSVVPVEPIIVPAVRDDEHSVAVQGERSLPAMVDNETAIAVQPQEVTLPSKIEAETKVMVTPSAEESAIHAVPTVVQTPPLLDVVTVVAKPIIELPIEPEIPISDRELKAAVILNALGENARALEEIDRYIKDKSESNDARHVKANILDDLGRIPECLDELKEAIRLDPKDEIALMDIESISRRLGRKEESMRILASITPSKEVRAREAVSLLDSKRYDEIITKSSNLGPLDSLVTRMTLAISYMAKARYREAYRILKEILLEHPTYPEALNNMGVCMRFMGEYAYDEPMHFMQLAVEADPNYGDAWNNIGATLFVLGDYIGAMESIRKAIAVDRRADYLINLSKCQIMVGDIAAAKLSLTSALKYEETAELDFALGLIAEKEGDMKWALKLYDSAIELSPNFKDAIFNRQRVKLFLKYTQK